MYTSATLSLASLEVLVHLGSEDWPIDLCAIPAEIPASLAIHAVTRADLPKRWRNFPSPASLRKIGDAWLEASETAVLAVPSAVIPVEKNYLLNPSHPDMKRSEIGAPQRFQFDLRLRSRGIS